MTDDRDDPALARALEGLPRAIEPPDDLWPAIHARLAPAERRRPWWRAPALRIAAGLLIIAAGALVLARQQAAGGRWRLASLDGAGARPRTFAAGESLATGGARALLEVGTIGHVEVDTATVLRLVESRATAQRLALVRGTIHARITAPPRLFVVETPAGVAVDLGCAYTLTVDSAGVSTLHVTLGWVAMETGPGSALVPAGFRVRSRPGGGAATPWADDAPERLVRAVRAFDGGEVAALDTALAAARPRDAITLWHLLSRTDGARREQVFAALAALAPPPDGVTRERLLALDAMALRLWWQELPGSLEVVPSWTRALWMAWLRIFG